MRALVAESAGLVIECGLELPARDTVFRATLCEGCEAEVRVCKNCTFYLPGAHWDCRETIPEAVRDKERANFCEYFRPWTGKDAGGRAAAEDGPADSRKATDRDKFNRLFGDG